MAARKKRPKRRVARKTAKPAAPARTRARAAPSKRRTPARARPATPAPIRLAACEPVPIGRVTHYFARAGAALLLLEAPLACGDWIHVRGATSDFLQVVASLESEGKRVQSAQAGVVGVRVEARVRPGDRVYRLAGP